jgi:GTP cyclohydrolase III
MGRSRYRNLLAMEQNIPKRAIARCEDQIKNRIKLDTNLLIEANRS